MTLPFPSSRPLNGDVVWVPTLSHFSSHCWYCYRRGFSPSSRTCPVVFYPFWVKTCLNKREGRRAANVRTTRVIGEALCSHPQQAVAFYHSAGAAQGEQLHPGTANRKHADQRPKPKPGTQGVVFSPENIIELLFLLLYFFTTTVFSHDIKDQEKRVYVRKMESGLRHPTNAIFIHQQRRQATKEVEVLLLFRFLFAWTPFRQGAPVMIVY